MKPQPLRIEVKGQSNDPDAVDGAGGVESKSAESLVAMTGAGAEEAPVEVGPVNSEVEALEGKEGGLGKEEGAGRERLKRGGRGGMRSWGAVLTHPVWTGGCGVLAVLLVGWGLFVRLPGNQVPVSARAGISLKELTGTALHPEAIAALREKVVESRDYLVGEGNELVQTVAELERLSSEQGWRAEVALQPALPGPVGLENVEVRPVTVSLVDRDEGEAGPFVRLMTFLREVKLRQKKVELVTLNLQADADGLHAALAEFRIWTDLSDETFTAK